MTNQGRSTCLPMAFMIVAFVLCAGPVLSEEPKYFPDLAFPKGLANFYAEFLDQMGEGPLYGKSLGKDTVVYRLVWFPGRSSVRLFRFERQGNRCQMRYVMLRDRGPEGIKDIEFEKVFALSEHEWKDLVIKVKGLNFWESPPGAARKGVILDGDSWILEGALGDKYNVLERDIRDVREGPDRHLLELFRLGWDKILEEGFGGDRGVTK